MKRNDTLLFLTISLMFLIAAAGCFGQRAGAAAADRVPPVSSRPHESRITIANGGWNLVGDLVIPISNRPVPAVILLNKAYGTRRAYEELAAHLARRGIASLRMDLRGHGESVNKDKFGPPFDEKMLAILVGTDTDVTAAISYLRRVKGIDPARVGVVGASYSGEHMAIAARATGYLKAYVALSPGSFSEQSINNIDTSKAAWLFVRSADERHLKGLHEAIRKSSKLAQFLEVSGDQHATELLASSPGLSEMIAVWFKNHL